MRLGMMPTHKATTIATPCKYSMSDSEKPIEDPASPRDLANMSLKQWWLPIPKPLEKNRLDYQYQQNIYFYHLIGISGFLAYLAYAIADIFVTPDIAELSIVTRIIFTAVAWPLSHWMVKHFKNVVFIELQGALFTTLAAVIWFELLIRSHSPYIPNYLFASVIFIVLINIGVRTAFLLVALPISLLLSFIVMYYAYFLNGKDPSVMLVYGLVYVPVLFFSLFISWHNAYMGRRLFLYAIINTLNTTDLKDANQKLWSQSHTDHLTGLPNRLLFNDQIQHAVARAKRDQSRLALMYIDLDKFKPVNDTYGHATGDLLLKDVAKRMMGCVRESDTVARIGGDEFIVMLPVIDALPDALRVADKILEALSQSFKLAGVELGISSSIGVAIFPEHGKDADTLSISADAALYRAKEAGRNRVELANPG